MTRTRTRIVLTLSNERQVSWMVPDPGQEQAWKDRIGTRSGDYFTLTGVDPDATITGVTTIQTQTEGTT